MIAPKSAESATQQQRLLSESSDVIRPVPDLIPVRMLNEFAYCPRLSYLEWVQGEWADNLETREGSFGHRVVDKPDRKQPPCGEQLADAQGKAAAAGESVAVAPPQEANPPEAIHARSIDVSAPIEGLIAKLDLLELEGNTATPVDYKRGKAPDIPEGAYEPERVQLAAQALILRENGYECTQGVIYFIESKRRVNIMFDDALIDRTRALAKELRQTAANGNCPPPLVDSPKCPRCSLVGICMPDEVNLLRLLEPTEATAEAEALTKPALRRLQPTKGAAMPLYVDEQGAMVGKTGDRLTISHKGVQKASVRLLDVSQLSVFGAVTITSAAIALLIEHGVPICHFSYGGWFNAVTTGHYHKNVELRIRQYAIAANADASLKLAREMVEAKIRNARTLLRRNLGDKHHPTVRKLKEYRHRVRSVENAESLLGLEGMAAKEYFATFCTLLPATIQASWEGRNRRPPKDPLNAVLSYLYGLLVKDVTVAVQSAGFDPMLGIFHRPRYGRPSLALDLAEEFRPLIADSTALMLFNNGEASADGFISRAGASTMTPPTRKSVLAAYERRMATEIIHPIFGYKISYRRVLEVQARLLARVMLGEIPSYPAFFTR